jgi:hypothetical protein
VRVPLLPAKAPADEQPLLADRHVAAGHHVARQAADVAPVAQDRPGIAQADRAEGQEGQRRCPGPAAGSARATTGPPGTETRRRCRPRRCKLHRWPQQTSTACGWAICAPTARCRWRDQHRVVAQAQALARSSPEAGDSIRPGASRAAPPARPSTPR